MRGPRTERSQNWFSIASLSAALVFLFPFALTQKDYRTSVTAGLKISLNRAAPPFAAFEDLHTDYVSDDITFPKVSQRLAAGEKWPVDRLVRQAPPRHITLQGLALRHERSTAETRIAEGVQPQPLVAASGSEQWIPTQAGGKILVSSSTPKPEPLAASAIPENVDLPVGWPSPRQEVESVEVAELNAPVRAIEEKPSVGRFWVRGQIEMTGGLAWIGPETHIEVRREHLGRSYETGRIWVNEGRFEIRIDKPVGALVGELKTREGITLGRGEIGLHDLARLAKSTTTVSDVRLALRPTSEGVAMKATSGYSHGHQEMTVASAKVEIEGQSRPTTVNDEGVFQEPTLDRASSFIARAQADKHWPTLIVGQARRLQSVRLFSESLVKALIELELPKGAEQRQALQRGVVWGQVRLHGQPVRGAEVELVGAGSPTYFNQIYLPDRRQKATESHGMFAYVNVPAGVQALRVKYQGRIFPAHIFATEDRHVSYVEVDIRDPMVAEVQVVDVFSPASRLMAHLKWVGLEGLVPVIERGAVRYTPAVDPSMVEADAGPEFEISRLTLAGAPAEIEVPLVRRDWLKSLYVARELTPQPGRGSIVGFVGDHDFEVEMTGVAPQERLQVIYFDSQGRILDSNIGVAGGGFAILNAPGGLQTVFVRPLHALQTHSQVVVAEHDYVHMVIARSIGR